jgi:large subunit ribosomal protein L4
VRRLALRSALSAKAVGGQLAVLDRLELEAPKTRALAGLLRALGWDRSHEGAGAVLLVIAAPDRMVERSAANLPALRVLPATALNVHDILASQRVLMTREALQRVTEALGR